MQGHDLSDGDTVVNKAAIVSVAVDVTFQCKGCGINTNKAHDDLRAKREFCTAAIKVGLRRKWHLCENQEKGQKLAKESRGGKARAAFQEKE